MSENEVMSPDDENRVLSPDEVVDVFHRMADAGMMAEQFTQEYVDHLEACIDSIAGGEEPVNTVWIDVRGYNRLEACILLRDRFMKQAADFKEFHEALAEQGALIRKGVEAERKNDS